ncbi:MAG: cell division protein FtsZ [Anaerolineales bacterium]|nr:cell division protein FtsZ [Anaerolineales bacterium]
MSEQVSKDPLEKLRQPAAPVREIGEVSVRVLGLGGGGSNAVNRMIQLGLSGVEFIAANTDRQALASSLAEVKLQLGPRITRGLGAGGDPRAGMAAAMESSREIATALAGADMVFITAGMGGGTGTGAAPVAAEIARELGAVVIAVVTMPFTFEMTRRAKNALEGVRKLQPHTHTLITVPNDRLLQIVPQDLSLEIAFRLADDVLRQGVQGIAELVTQPGMINVDFAHVRELMIHGGGAYMAIGLGKGENKAADAIHQALHHPLLELDHPEQASGVLIHFTGGEDLTLFEVGGAVTELRESLAPDAEVILGATTDPSMNTRAQAIIIFTGVGGRAFQPAPRAQALEIEEAGPTEAVPIDEDLDLPTFLRRRVDIGQRN